MTEQTDIAIQDRAKLATTYFQKMLRPNNGETFIRLVKADAPTWVHELINDASEDPAQTDDRSGFAYDAVEDIAAGADGEDGPDEFAEEVAPFDRDRIAYLAAKLERTGYVGDILTEYAAESGKSVEQVQELWDVLNRYQTRKAVFKNVYAKLAAGI